MPLAIEQIPNANERKWDVLIEVNRIKGRMFRQLFISYQLLRPRNEQDGTI